MRRTIVLVVAAVVAILPVPASMVERVYSTGFYAFVQPYITGLSNRVGVALFDVLLVCAAAVLLVILWRTIRAPQRTSRRVGELLLSVATLAATVYLAFIVLWGLNYRRVPLVDKLQYDASRVSSASAMPIARQAVGVLNQLYAPAHRAGWTTTGLIDPGLAGAFAATQRLIGSTRLARPARPKLTILDPYFRRAGVSGMTDPYFLETLVDSSLLPYERPFVVAHEWAHLAGYADEGEANFVGWLTCVRAREPEQYSGWLFLYEELIRSVLPSERGAVARALDGGVRADLRAIADRIRHNVNPTVAVAGWRAYDQYLKANRVAEGAASYETVVRLVLGVNFGDGWVPQRR